MPQSEIFLDQTSHIGSSGTLVSDEELQDASGVLNGYIDYTHSQIFPTASGLIDGIINLIPAKGDETDSKPRTKWDVPVNEYVKSADTSTWWSIRQPFGQVASGITLYTAWFVDSPAAQDVHFEVAVKPVSSGTNLSTVTADTHTGTRSANAPANVVQVSEAQVPFSEPAQFVSFRFTRKGSAAQDTFTNSVFVLAHGIRFEVL